MIQKIKNNAFARNSLILFSGTMVVNVLNYFFHLALGRMVSAEIYGEIESLLALTAIISVPSTVLVMVATKYSASCKAENNPGANLELIEYLNKKILIYGFPILAVLLILTPWVENFLNIKSALVIILVWVTMFISFLLAITGGAINGWQKFMDANWIGIWGSITKLIGAIILIKIGLALGGAIAGNLLGIVVSFLISLYALKFILKRKKTDQDKSYSIEFSSLKKYILPVFWGNLAMAILLNADVVLAKHALSSLAAGQYGALTIVSKIIFYATLIVATVLFAMAAEDDHKKKETFPIFKNAFYLLLLFSGVALIFYFSFPRFVISFVFGNKYTDVSYYLGWFAVAVVLSSFTNLIFQYLMSIHQTRVAYALLIVSLVFITVIILFGHSIFGIITIVATTQLVAIGICLYYLFSDKKPAKLA